MNKCRVDVLLAMVIIVGGFLCDANAGGYTSVNYNVTSTARIILPPVSVSAPTRVTNTVYAQGALVSGNTATSHVWKFWAETAGTSGTNSSVNPNWNAINDVTDGSVVWRPLNIKRRRLYVQNHGTNIVYLEFNGGTASAGKGAFLVANGVLGYAENAYQGPLSAIISSGSSTSVVSVVEIPQ